MVLGSAPVIRVRRINARRVHPDGRIPWAYDSLRDTFMTAGAQAGAACTESVVDLLGGVAYGELTAFFRLTTDAEMAPTLADKIELGRLAVAEFHHFELLRTRLEELGHDPIGAMEPFRHAVDAFHARTAPSSWLEGLVKTFIGDQVASDFYREISVWCPPTTRELVQEVLTDLGHADFVVRAVRRAVEEDERVAGRLALWARRLAGETLSQAQLVLAEREPLAAFLTGTAEGPGTDLSEFARTVGRLTVLHTRRMAVLGLSA
jgi:hypothetical protein